MATVVIQKRRRKRGVTYQIHYAHPITGQKKYYKTCGKLKEAQWEVDQLKALINSGKIPQNRTKLDPLTFSEVALSLREDWFTKLRRKELSETTIKGYCAKLGVLERALGKKLLCKMTKEDVLEFRDAQIEKNSIISANRYLTMLKFVFSHGLKVNAIIDDPVKDIKLLNEKYHERKKFLLPQELDRVIEASRKTRAKYYLPAIILLGAEHGASKQEILSLTWSDIDFQWSEKGFIHLFRTKNRMERTEFLMPRTKEALLHWKAHLEKKRKKTRIRKVKSDSVFCRIDGTPLREFKSSWQNCLEIAGIKDFHFHDLRHTFSSNLLLSGATLKDVKEMIGHRNISMTDRYSHLSLNHKLFWQNQLSEHYSNSR
jgi:integrase